MSEYVFPQLFMLLQEIVVDTFNNNLNHNIYCSFIIKWKQI